MNKLEKLKLRPIESDTKIYSQDLVEFNSIAALMEYWFWDGIAATSVIFLEADVAQKSDDELKKMVFEGLKTPIDPHTTISKNEGYVFVNFNFETF